MTVLRGNGKHERTEPLRVAVVGGGAWGTTLGALASAGGATTLWAHEPEVVSAIRDDHQNHLFLPGFELPPTMDATSELDAALDGVDVVVVAVPSQHLRAVMTSASPWITEKMLIVSVAKGIEVCSSMRMTEVLIDVLPNVKGGRYWGRRRPEPRPRGDRRTSIGNDSRLH